MEVTTDILDITSYEKRKLKPATLITRDNKTWITRELPLLMSDTGEWGICKEGEMVRIPLFPYLTRNADPTVAMGFAFELGLRAVEAIGNEIERLHITLGHPVCEHTTAEGAEVLRFWLGFGFVLKDDKCLTS